MNRNEFNELDVIVFIGSRVKWIIGTIEPHLINLTRITPDGWPSETSCYTKTYCKKNAILVGKWNREEMKEIDEA